MPSSAGSVAAEASGPLRVSCGCGFSQTWLPESAGAPPPFCKTETSGPRDDMLKRSSSQSMLHSWSLSLTDPISACVSSDGQPSGTPSGEAALRPVAGPLSMSTLPASPGESTNAALLAIDAPLLVAVADKPNLGLCLLGRQA
eukprot:CAMPEP_0115490026 /NCGR_PEP_ID=MMETSP0271-20121206/62333_1 /TAXON_ID=71861 /ORGANISM="Scrippsiella trochoidea, Strain CCMP3099" /LENGTH=142 /DNA_ID=CAMNT_0002918243 /DNA_START=140 /DNA_END=565 /DNA_ORIENTATION=-